jgi:hypothetical protein
MSRTSTRQSVSEFLRNHWVDETPIDPNRKPVRQIRTANQLLAPTEPVQS